jgi:hypothetical protein
MLTCEIWRLHSGEDEDDDDVVILNFGVYIRR